MLYYRRSLKSCKNLELEAQTGFGARKGVPMKRWIWVVLSVLVVAVLATGCEWYTRVEEVPVARISIEPAQPWYANQGLTFNCQLEMMPVTQIIVVSSQGIVPAPTDYTCEWNFGDGQSGVGTTVYHAYAYLGQYVVWLSVKYRDDTILTSQLVFIQPPVQQVEVSVSSATVVVGRSVAVFLKVKGLPAGELVIGGRRLLDKQSVISQAVIPLKSGITFSQQLTLTDVRVVCFNECLARPSLPYEVDGQTSIQVHARLFAQSSEAITVLRLEFYCTVTGDFSIDLQNVEVFDGAGQPVSAVLSPGTITVTPY